MEYLFSFAKQKVRILNNIKPRNVACIFFVIFSMATLVVTIMLYYVWNRPAIHYNEANNRPLKNFHVDRCQFSNEGVNISGWAFIPEESFTLNQVFIVKNNDEIAGLITGLVLRYDVSKHFSQNGQYIRSGFIASRQEKNSNFKFKKEIIITSTSKSGTTYAAKYTCN